MVSETIHLEGHIVDSLTLSKVLDLILLQGGTYEIGRFDIGATRVDPSRAEITVMAPDANQLENILHIIGQHGATRPTEDAVCEPAPADGVFPDSFYSTTNLQSFVRRNGQWIPVEQIEMDCGIVVEERPDGTRARTIPLHAVKMGNAVVVGDK